ncbi:MAG: hypothetical protein KDD11_15510 [Acidobacteria bacterium]|nr:hypothetical protein [Acidobacteriota bacterium]
MPVVRIVPLLAAALLLASAASSWAGPPGRSGSKLSERAAGQRDSGQLSDKTAGARAGARGDGAAREGSAEGLTSASGRSTSGDRDSEAMKTRAESLRGSDQRSGTVELPEPNPQQQANLQQLKKDLSVIASGAKDAEDEIQNLAKHLQGMALQPPDPALVEQLATDLSAAVSDGSLSPKEMAQLTQAVYGVLNSAGLSQAELETLQDDVESILAASGVGRSEIEAVVHDLEAIYGSIQKPSSGSASERKSGRSRPGRG